MNGDRVSSASAAPAPVREQSPSVAAGRGSLVEFAVEDVACRIELVAIDRVRRLAAYDVLLANKRGVDLTCRLYGIEKDRRMTNIALFEAAPNSLARSRFFVPLGRRSRWERVFIEIAGEGTALLFETHLPSPASPESARRNGAIGVALGAFALAVVLLLVVMHAAPPRHVGRATHSVAFAVPKSHARPAPARPRGASPRFIPIDDGLERADAGFAYAGAWQHIKNMHDGRSAGTSSRTYHAGDRAAFTYRGERFKLYGVKGPTGGYAELSIDGKRRAMLLFYAPKKQVDAELYASESLPRGKHVVDVLVIDVLHGAGKRRYVNIDGASYRAR